MRACWTVFRLLFPLAAVVLHFVMRCPLRVHVLFKNSLVRVLAHIGQCRYETVALLDLISNVLAVLASVWCPETACTMPFCMRWHSVFCGS